MTKIAIEFHDNDFLNLFTGILKTIAEALKWKDISNVINDKERLAFIINEMVLSHYILFQDTYEYDNVNIHEKESQIKMKEYLKVKPEMLYVNKEVDKYKDEVDYGNLNSETFILEYNSHLETYTIYSM